MRASVRLNALRPNRTNESAPRHDIAHVRPRVTVTDRFFIRPDDFDLQAFANQGFGLFQRDDEYGEIEWRFLPVAAEQAKGTLFHPEQTEEMQPDGSLIIRFKAAGHVEMAWYLYQWGDKVELLKPEALKAMVADHRRGDFPAMP